MAMAGLGFKEARSWRTRASTPGCFVQRAIELNSINTMSRVVGKFVMRHVSIPDTGVLSTPLLLMRWS